jgi:hypothetical protein
MGGADTAGGVDSSRDPAHDCDVWDSGDEDVVPKEGACEKIAARLLRRERVAVASGINFACVRICRTDEKK